MEEKRDTFAFSGLSVYYLTEEYNADYPPKWLKKLEKKDPELEFKSPYETTRRFVAYLEDDKNVYDQLVSNNNAEKHFIFSDRDKVKKEEDTTAINNTKQFYSFWSNRSDQAIRSSKYGPALDPAEDGTLTCRYCHAEMKQKKAFTRHEAICKEKLIQREERLFVIAKTLATAKPVRKITICGRATVSMIIYLVKRMKLGSRRY